MKTPRVCPRARVGTLCRLFALAVAGLGCSLSLLGQTATGSISGRVHNEATGQYLNNARIIIKGTGLSTLTDDTGSFRITGVPSGTATIDAFYSGLDPLQVTVDVPAGGSVERVINLTNKAAYGDKTSTVKLDAYVLSASKLTEGEALATNEQRFAPNLKNVVASDAFGDVTEGNVAEFMKFLPGVTIEYSDASPNAVAVRGFDPNMTSVTMDGSSMANASGSAVNRNFLFTQVGHVLRRQERQQYPHGDSRDQCDAQRGGWRAAVVHPDPDDRRDRPRRRDLRRQLPPQRRAHARPQRPLPVRQRRLERRRRRGRVDLEVLASLP